MARSLRENLAKFKDALAKGEVERVKEFQEMIKEGSLLIRMPEKKRLLLS